MKANQIMFFWQTQNSFFWVSIYFCSVGPFFPLVRFYRWSVFFRWSVLFLRCSVARLVMTTGCDNIDVATSVHGTSWLVEHCFPLKNISIIKMFGSCMSTVQWNSGKLLVKLENNFSNWKIILFISFCNGILENF